MTRSLQSKFLCLLLALPFLAGCNDDAPYYGEGVESELNGHYSNRLSKDPLAGELELTYSGEELVGKEFYFHLITDNTAKIVFNDLIYGEPVISFDNHAVNKTSAGGYSFKGSGTTDKGISYSYEGEVYRPDKAILPVMKLEVKDVAFPANELATMNTFKTFEAINYDPETVMDENGVMMYFLYKYDFNLDLFWNYLDVNGTERPLISLMGNDLTKTAQSLVSSLIYLTVDEFYFHSDGNISVKYMPLKEGVNFMSATAADRGTATISPINLVTYYTEDNSTVYIKPDLDNILKLVAKNQTRADNDGFNIADILALLPTLIEIYPEITRWLDTGFKFKLEPHSPDNITEMPGSGSFVQESYKGKYRLYIEEEEVLKIVKLLPIVWNLVSLDLPVVNIGDYFPPMPITIDLNEVVGEIIDNAQNTTYVRLGLFLD